MFTPKPSPPPLVPRPAAIMIALGAVAALAALAVRFDDRAGGAPQQELHAIADGVLRSLG
jgi:hypothetical protein